MPVDVFPMGKLYDEREVSRYVLTNRNNVRADFCDLGAIWLNMFVPDRKGRIRDVVLSLDKAEDLPRNPGHMGEPIGRNANRIAGGSFFINGIPYDLALNDHGINNIHSGPDFWRIKSWNADYGEFNDGSPYVSFSLFSPDMDQGFPGNLNIRVTYTLTDDNELFINYNGVCDADTVINMTNHAFFNLAGHESGNAMEQVVWINADSFTPIGEDLIPTGEIRRVMGTPMDFRTPRRIDLYFNRKDEQLEFGKGYDHNWCLNDYNGKERLVASAYAPSSGIKMEVYTDLEGLQFYTANMLSVDGNGKGGVSYTSNSGYCFETQHYPDCLNKENFPTSIVKAGEEYDSTTSFRFSTVY